VLRIRFVNGALLSKEDWEGSKDFKALPSMEKLVDQQNSIHRSSQLKTQNLKLIFNSVPVLVFLAASSWAVAARAFSLEKRGVLGNDPGYCQESE
jgi:hypothetical protein